MTGSPEIKTKNVYNSPAPEDGWRLLIMRRWPRGIPKQAVDAWDKELGPSLPLLEKWRQNELNWDIFCREYEAEVMRQPERLRALEAKARQETVTLLCGCQDEGRCHRSVLRRLLMNLSGSDEVSGFKTARKNAVGR